MRSARNVVSFGVPAYKNLYLSLPFVPIRAPRSSLCRIHPVSVLIPSVLRELFATVVCLPLPPHQNCPCCKVRSLSQCVVLYERNRTDEAHVYSKTESKVFVLCVVSIERRRLAQASQVLVAQRKGTGVNRSELLSRRKPSS